MEFVIGVPLAILGIAATLFGVFQGVEWLLTKLRRQERRLGGKGRVVRRDDLTTLEPRDVSRFVRDIELVDGTVVSPNARFRKTWEIQNVGSVVWEGRYLERVGAPEGPGLIKSPVRAPVPTTRPGDVVQLTVELEAPSTEGTSTARFKMADKDGNLCFPNRYREGLFVTVNVVEERDKSRATATKGDDEGPPAVSVTERQHLSDLVRVEEDARWDRPLPGGPTLGRTLGLKVVNLTDGEITNCSVRLEALEFWGEDSQQWFQPEWFSPLLLAWSFNDSGGASKTIGPRSNRTCDLAAYERQDATHAIIIAAEDRLRERNQIQFGTWRAACKIEADSCLPSDSVAVFDWEPENTQVGQLRRLEFRSLSSPEGRAQ